jgi:hypothetical protein
MNAYYADVRKLENHFKGLEFHHVSRDNNVAVDVLSKLGSKRALVPTSVFIQDLYKTSIILLSNPETLPSNVSGSRDVLMAEAEVDWRPDFIAYITEKRIREDKVEREKIIRCATNYVIIGTELYRRSASSGVLMKCILRSQGLELLQEIHGGECGNHAAFANLVGKAYRSGFYWPTAMADAQDLVRRCKGCQFFTKQQHVLAQVLRTIPPSWPFAIWGLDSVGPFKTAPGGYKHILVVVTKSPSGLRSMPSPQSRRKRLRSSSKTSPIGSGYPTGSSPTKARPSQGRSRIFARTASSTSTTPRWPTHGETAKSSKQMAWCFKPSKTASSTTLRSTRLGGMPSCLTSFGVSEPR